MNQQSIAPIDQANGPGRRQQVIELTVFLFLVVPSMAVSLAGVADPEAISFTQVALTNILRDLALTSLVLYFVWSNGEGFPSIGLLGRDLGREAALGALLFLPLYLLLLVVQMLLSAVGLSGLERPPSFLIPTTMGQYLLAVVFLVVVAFSEEVIFRGYLIKRFAALTGRAGSAVLLAAIVFSLGHGYQGTGGVVAVGVLGIAFGWIYLWRGSLVAPMVIHFIQNFIGIIVAPFYA